MRSLQRAGVCNITERRSNSTYNPSMPTGLKRYYGAGNLHFITCSCYRPTAVAGYDTRSRFVSAHLGTDTKALPFCRSRIRHHAGTRSAAYGSLKSVIRQK